MKPLLLLPLLFVGAVSAMPTDAATTVEVTEPLTLPGFTAYSEPNPESPDITEKGIRNWSNPKDRIVWYGRLSMTGTLELSLSVRLPKSGSSRLRLEVSPVTPVGGEKKTAPIRRDVEVEGGAFSLLTPIPSIRIPAPGYYRFALEGISKTGETFGEPLALTLSGPAAGGAHFNLKPRRNAASVHLGYPLPPQSRVTAFYNEMTVETEPLWSYYMACGFHRGYFGIQVNSPTERRIIFSVWDSGDEAIDRDKVAAEDRVHLLAKGEGVVADSFGNEGTGGHSHLVYPWKKGQTYRFLVTAQPGGTFTTYSGYFYFPEKQAWGLIARFRAPKDGEHLRGLYSFNENFWGANGQRERRAEFGPAWVRAADGEWKELRTARFTHDPTGKEDRQDYDAGVARGRFFLSNGGFKVGGLKYGDEFTRPSVKAPPKDLTPFPTLP